MDIPNTFILGNPSKDVATASSIQLLVRFIFGDSPKIFDHKSGGNSSRRRGSGSETLTSAKKVQYCTMMEGLLSKFVFPHLSFILSF